MAGTTPVTTLGEPLFYVCRNSDKDSALSRRTYRTDDLHIIKKYYYELDHKIFVDKLKEVVTGTNFSQMPGLAIFYS